MGTLCTLNESKAAQIAADMLARLAADIPAGKGKPHTGRVSVSADGSNVLVYVNLEEPGANIGKLVLEFRLAAYTWPLMFSYGSWVSSSYQGFGLGNHMQEAKDMIARDVGYTTLICTVSPDNNAELALMRKHNWKMIGEVDSTYVKAYASEMSRLPTTLKRAGIWIREVSKLPMEEEVPRAPRKIRSSRRINYTNG